MVLFHCQENDCRRSPEQANDNNVTPLSYHGISVALPWATTSSQLQNHPSNRPVRAPGRSKWGETGSCEGKSIWARGQRRCAGGTRSVEGEDGSCGGDAGRREGKSPRAGGYPSGRGENSPCEGKSIWAGPRPKTSPWWRASVRRSHAGDRLQTTAGTG